MFALSLFSKLIYKNIILLHTLSVQALPLNLSLVLLILNCVAYRLKFLFLSVFIH